MVSTVVADGTRRLEAFESVDDSNAPYLNLSVGPVATSPSGQAPAPRAKRASAVASIMVIS